MSKRSQMEIMGLAIIIILITLGLIFAVRFVVLKKPTEFKKEYTQIELASNMINTLLRTTAQGCSGVSFTELFQDCSDAYPYGTIDCGSEKSCDYLQSKVPDIFDKTFGEWNLGYYFEAVAGTNTLVSDGDACPPGDKTHKEFPIPSGVTTINVKLDLCG